MTIDSSTYKKKKKKSKKIGELVIIRGNDAPKKRHHKRHVNQISSEDISRIEQNTNPFRFSMVGANSDGSKIFCLLKMRSISKSGRVVWKRVIEGFYDFDKYDFIITAERKLYKNPSYPGAPVYTHDEVIAMLRENLDDYDWEYKGE